MVPLVLNLSTRRRWVVNLTPWPLDSWERISVPTEQYAAWAPELVWTFWRREKSFVTAAIQALDCPLHNQVFVLIILPQLQQEFSNKRNVHKYHLQSRNKGHYSAKLYTI